MLPGWVVPGVKYTIPVTVGKKLPKAVVNDPNLKVSGFRLAWAALTSGRPPAAFPSAVTLAGRDYRRWRIWASLGMLEPDGAGGLRRTQEFDALDPTEKAHLNYALAGAIAKAYAAEKLDSPWLAHLSLALKATPKYAAVFDKQVARRPDYFGVNLAGNFFVAEAKGRVVLRKALRDSLDAKEQTKGVTHINAAAPVAQYGFAATATPRGVSLYATDPETEIRLEISPDEWLRRYYTMLVDVAAAIDGTGAEPERAQLGAEQEAWRPYRLNVPDLVREWTSEDASPFEQLEAAALLSGLQVGGGVLNPDYTWLEEVIEAPEPGSGLG